MNDAQIDTVLLSCLSVNSVVSSNACYQSLLETDWEELLQQSDRHGVSPLLYHRLKTIHPEIPIPPEITARLRQAYLVNAARNLGLFHNLAAVLNLLHRENIPVIALKGAHLAELVYSNPALRYMGDLDLLVQEQDLSKVDALLLAMGCTPNEQNRIVGNDNNEFVYVMPKRDVSLEIHWSILSSAFPFSIDTGGQWERSRPALIAGAEAAVLCPEDLLLHLCIHAGCTHGFEPGLKLFCDISEILHHKSEAVDWERLQRRAHEWGVEKCVYLTLRLTAELLGEPLPADLMQALKPGDFREYYLDLAKDQIFSRKLRTGPPLSMWPAVARFWGTSRFQDKVRLFINGFFLPREAMARLYPVPAHSARVYFYYFVRLKDLLKTYGRDGWRWLIRDAGMHELARDGKNLTTLKDWLSSGIP